MHVQKYGKNKGRGSMKEVPRERYRLYLDESGDHVFHDEVALRKPGHRYLTLVGCWFNQGAPYLTFHRNLEGFKQKHIPHSPDEPVILHRKDIINRSGYFWRLRDKATTKAFDDDLCSLVKGAKFVLVGVCIDKLRMKQEYPVPFHPYHLALGFILERYCGLLNHINRQGDVLAESRGGKEDRQLKNAYRHIWTYGTWYHKAEFFQRALTSKEIKLKKKTDNIAGLQLADILARAVRDDILAEFGETVESTAPFDCRLIPIIQTKYNRHLYDGRVRGYGKILFPK